MNDPLLSNEPIFFDRDDPNLPLYKKIIKKNEDQFEKGYISSCLSSFTHGFILLGSNLNGRAIISTVDRYYLRGYVLFQYDPRLALVTGKNICAIKNSNPDVKIGRKLLNAVYSFILENKVETWKINSTPKLISYYENFEFEQCNTIYVRGKAKVVRMIRLIHYDEKDGEDEIEGVGEGGKDFCEFDDDI